MQKIVQLPTMSFTFKAIARPLMYRQNKNILLQRYIWKNCTYQSNTRSYVRGVKPFIDESRQRVSLHSDNVSQNEINMTEEIDPERQGMHSKNVDSSPNIKSESVKELLDNAVPFSPLPENTWATSPYPKGVKVRDQSHYALRPSIDPQETSIILFPGQGTQYVGMGKDLLKFPNVRDMFDAASDILGYNLMTLCFEGPKNELDKTIYCQPAVFITSLAAIERLQEERPKAIESCVGAAGFSVGEITALVFAGALSFEDGVRLIKVRAEAMQFASEIVPSGMMVVMYGPDSKLEYACLVARKHCSEMGIEEPDCKIANYLYPHCKVIAGNKEALEFIQKNAADFKLRRLKWLPVSGAFHTDLMRPAVEPFKQALHNVKIHQPAIPVHSNIDGKMYRNDYDILKKLPKQIYKPVKWEQTLHVLYERQQGHNFPRTFECGPGKSLLPILKMVNAKAWDSGFSINA